MTWSPPHIESQNGKIRGYKIIFVPSEDYYDKQEHVATTTNQYYTIENAMKYTNYTISVLAYTSVGDGAKTKEFYCITNEDCKLLFLFIYSVISCQLIYSIFILSQYHLLRKVSRQFHLQVQILLYHGYRQNIEMEI